MCNYTDTGLILAYVLIIHMSSLQQNIDPVCVVPQTARCILLVHTRGLSGPEALVDCQIGRYIGARTPV
jgi:hypothetical protein